MIETLRDLYSTTATDNEIVSSLYDFTGRLLKTKTRQEFLGNSNTVIQSNKYDNQGRLIQVKHQVNGGSEVILASMEYNETGQLKQKSLHGSVGNGIQNLNYSYNIRGWLERINNPESTPSSTQKFNLGLYYNNVPSGISVNPQYNGNISAMAWNTPENSQALSPADKQGYGYSYDGLNRLTSAVYGEGTYFSTNAGANNESLTYDLNGNIKTLSRYKKGTGLIDNLTYYYKNSESSNMLDRVDDTAGSVGFSENVQQSNEYGYDPNGNLSRDDNKGYNYIDYNYLNLPWHVGKNYPNNEYITYIYDAAGTKLAKIGTSGNYTWYAGGFVYNGSSLNYILTSEGMWLPGGSYNYYLKDHLGNTRLAVNTSGPGGTVVQQTDYYPFGMDIAVYNGGLDNKYRYNGKEFQEDVINSKSLSWYDYGARFYDPQIGRWMTKDPKAEQYYSYSIYHFTADNPINLIDPDGQSYYYFADGTFLFQSDDKKNDVFYWNLNKENTQHGGFDALKHKGKTVQNGDLTLLASTAYGESSGQNNKDEVYGISNAIVNNMDLHKNGTIKGTINGFALAATDGNKRTSQFNETSADDRNCTFMQTALGGAINALSGGQDYSYGATHWAGSDIGSSSEKRATGGLLFSKQSHDIYSLGSKTKSADGTPTKGYNADGSYRNSYSYTWQTTAAYGGTTFMKKTDKFIIATGAPRY